MTIIYQKNLSGLSMTLSRPVTTPARTMWSMTPSPGSACLPRDTACPTGVPSGLKPAKQKKPLTKEEFHRHLVEIGLMSQLPDTDADYDDPDDQLIDIKGEPLSETIIRERR